ncbi:MAG: molybdenum ABC transporter ATP-binding protein, partial [Streptococcus sp.]|nr:molybdenum ABC transporter ATP-binding protein [Streptococcus sp.]
KIVAQGPKNDIITPEVLADFYQNPVQIIPIDDHRFYINPLL